MYLLRQWMDCCPLLSTLPRPGSSFVADYFSAAVIEGTSPLKEAQVLRQFDKRSSRTIIFLDPA